MLFKYNICFYNEDTQDTDTYSGITVGQNYPDAMDRVYSYYKSERLLSISLELLDNPIDEYDIPRLFD